MGRKKIRNYPSKQFYEDMLDNYFNEHADEVKTHLMDTLGYSDFDMIWEDECKMKWGFDCGWILLYPTDAKMSHEWELDNGKYGNYIFTHPTYNCQSTTLQKIQVKKAVEDLGLDELFWVATRLD